MLSDCPVAMIEKSANGSVSGSESRIVSGWSHDSNWAARIRYMKTSDRPNASMKARPVRASSRERPANLVRYSGPRFSRVRGRLHRVHHGRLPDARQQAGVDRHLPLAVQPLDLRRRRARLEGGDVVERHAAQPRRRHGQAADVARGPAIARQRAQVHLVLLAALVVGGDLVAADEQPHRFGGVADLHAEVGGLRAVQRDLELRLPGIQRDVHVDRAGHLARFGGHSLGVLLQFRRCRGRSRRTGSRRSAALLRPWPRWAARPSAARPTRTASSAPCGWHRTPRRRPDPAPRGEPGARRSSPRWRSRAESSATVTIVKATSG